MATAIIVSALAGLLVGFLGGFRFGGTVERKFIAAEQQKVLDAESELRRKSLLGPGDDE